MKVDLGIKPYIFPMPVLMVATYGENDKIDVMNAAWGNICAENMVSLNIDEEHMTAKNIKKNMAFTLSIADIDHIKEADFFGIAAGQYGKASQRSVAQYLSARPRLGASHCHRAAFGAR